jgi:hypothetical protein
MQLFFAGAEVPAHLNLLKACGVQRVAVNVNNLARFTSSYDTWASRQRLDGLDWICYADTPLCPAEPVLALLQGSEVTVETVAGPATWAEDTWIGNSDLQFLPIWDGNDASILRGYIEDYEGVVLPSSVADNAVTVRTARAALPTMGTLAGLTGKSKGIERFDTLISSAWWAVQKHGETQVWVGNRLVRLNSDDKHLKRQRYTEAIEALGCDVGAVLADDPTESVRCAVLSWMALERQVAAHRAMPVVANSAHGGLPNNVTPLRGVASAPVQTRHQSASGSALSQLPVMGLETITNTSQDADGNDVLEQHDLIEVTAASARQCTTCQLSAACPAFSPGSACSYQIPVVIKTKDQRQAVMRALMEIQTQRILMGSFSEQVLGIPDVQVGKEIDRLMAVIEKAKAIEENTSRLRISVDAAGESSQAASLGVISRLFGETAGANARALEHPIMVDEMIEDADMADD